MPLAALGAMLVLVTSLAVAVRESATVGRMDLTLVGDLRPDALAPVTDWVFGVTALGSTGAIIPITALAVAVLITLRHWRGALALAFSVALTQAAVALVKALVSRPRPPAADALSVASGFSFPSGHAATSAALYVTLAFLAARACRGPARATIVLAGTLLVLAVGASRVYLGVHYPTDVVAGWLTGGAVALASWLAVSRMRALQVANDP